MKKEIKEVETNDSCLGCFANFDGVCVFDIRNIKKLGLNSCMDKRIRYEISIKG